MNAKVTTIIPVFNDQSGIEACLRALELQLYPAGAMEVIVVDNGSRPPIKLVASDWPFPVRLVHCEKPGSYAARNAGVAHAGGDFLAFTDADCTPDQHWIAAGAGRLASDGDAAFGGEVVVEALAERTATSLYQELVGFQQRENVLHKGFAVTANLFCTRQTFMRVGPFDEGLLSGGDLEWGHRARQLGIATHFLPDAIVHTRPRKTLGSAIRQARRVAAGRLHLQRRQSSSSTPMHLAPHRGTLEAVKWISTHPDLSNGERLRVLGVATIIRIASHIERMRLFLGGAPERR